MPFLCLKSEILNTQSIVDTGGRIEALYQIRAKNVSVHFLLNKIVELNVLKVPSGAFFMPEI
ncbi:hypothetical protein ACLKMH_22355 [Psychromonas sp. KJ10-10]|uniref:hypothetical protein n=1 Tax=Psychromonas sp. KJ10-10 TaxID=3391823 RepID=UPI0039B515F1